MPLSHRECIQSVHYPLIKVGIEVFHASGFGVERWSGRQEMMPLHHRPGRGPQAGHPCIVQADNRDDHLTKGGRGQTVGFGGCQKCIPPIT